MGEYCTWNETIVLHVPIWTRQECRFITIYSKSYASTLLQHVLDSGGWQRLILRFMYQEDGQVSCRGSPSSLLERLVTYFSESAPIPRQHSIGNPFRNCSRSNVRQLGPRWRLHSIGFLRKSPCESIPTCERYWAKYLKVFDTGTCTVTHRGIFLV